MFQLCVVHLFYYNMLQQQIISKLANTGPSGSQSEVQMWDHRPLRHHQQALRLKMTHSDCLFLDTHRRRNHLFRAIRTFSSLKVSGGPYQVCRKSGFHWPEPKQPRIRVSSRRGVVGSVSSTVNFHFIDSDIDKLGLLVETTPKAKKTCITANN